jgi:uncharacterized membrane protein YdjX (TVP38/TMEM64 family)
MKRLVIAAVIAAALVAAGFVLPIATWAITAVEWIRDAGAIGVAVFAVGYVAAAVLLLPGSVLTLGAGFVYGPLWGVLLVSPVSVIASTAAFALARSAVRSRIEQRVAGQARIGALDRAIAAEGGKIVLLLRLSPIIPYNVLNYALGLTGIRMRSYVVASAIGMLPGTILYVYLGSSATSAAEVAAGGGAAGGWQQVLYWGGLAATLAVTVLITRLARRALRRSLDRAAPDGTTTELQEVAS